MLSQFSANKIGCHQIISVVELKVENKFTIQNAVVTNTMSQN